MKYRENRRTGDKISEIGMGTAYIGKMYSLGLTEKIIGAGKGKNRFIV